MLEPPIQRCQVCGRVVVVNPNRRGFPPERAKRQLVRLCKVDGHKADPQYRAGYDPRILRGPSGRTEATDG